MMMVINDDDDDDDVMMMIVMKPEKPKCANYHHLLTPLNPYRRMFILHGRDDSY